MGCFMRIVGSFFFFVCVREMMIMMINHLWQWLSRFFQVPKACGSDVPRILSEFSQVLQAKTGPIFPRKPGGFSGGCGWWRLQWLWHGTQWPCGILGGSFGCRSAQDMLICDGVDHYDLLLYVKAIINNNNDNNNNDNSNIYIIPSSSY